MAKSLKKRKNHQERLKAISLNRIIPNVITLAALCVGFSGVKYALMSKWETAVICVLIAAILDGMDGRIARLLGGTSKFGAELDSFADACNFGVTPALIIYLFSLQHLNQFGWAVSLFFVVCIVFRLARFNTFLGLEDTEDDSSSTRFFMGLSAPLGAIYSMVPMMIYFETNRSFELSPFVYAIYLICVALLIISRLPTFSFKGGGVPKKWAWLLFVGIGMFGVFITTAFWLALLVLGLLFLISIPFSYQSYQKEQK
jgi:CDP-diacylglycerol--serine O-phosphatidyltransferase